jgi:hypothetical protein
VPVGGPPRRGGAGLILISARPRDQTFLIRQVVYTRMYTYPGPRHTPLRSMDMRDRSGQPIQSTTVNPDHASRPSAQPAVHRWRSSSGWTRARSSLAWRFRKAALCTADKYCHNLAFPTLSCRSRALAATPAFNPVSSAPMEVVERVDPCALELGVAGRRRSSMPNLEVIFDILIFDSDPGRNGPRCGTIAERRRDNA